MLFRTKVRSLLPQAGGAQRTWAESRVQSKVAASDAQIWPSWGLTFTRVVKQRCQ